MSDQGTPAESAGYRIAKESLAEIQERYDDLLDACERYVERLQEEIARAEQDPSLPQQYALRMKMHVSTGGELVQVLETFVHDAMVRASDRAILIQIAAEGRFV